ncbi:MAG: TonB-dependent receptor [Bdellovibrionaceae bacterium]|nr:TonB-dependent receptor [Pseudobdellovibrionaceae bacterium]
MKKSLRKASSRTHASGEAPYGSHAQRAILQSTETPFPYRLLLTILLGLVANTAVAQETPTSQPADSAPAATATAAPTSAPTPTRTEIANPILASQVERVEVTGSRIKRISVEGPSPVTVVDKEAIKKSGHNSVSDLLRDMTASSFGVSRENSGSSAAGVSTIGLRGLGAERTLVLLNGRRLPKDPAAEAVDLNMIPMAAIERVEILKDGASALYGSDALGGVVNIITKKNFNGTDISLKHVRPEETRGQQYEVAMTTGSSNDRSSLMTVLNYRNNSILFGRDREWSRDGISLTGSPGAYRDQAGSNTWTVDPNCPAGRQRAIPGGQTCTYNYQEQASTLPGVEQITLLTDFRYKIDDQLTLYNVNSASRRTVKWTFAPTPGSLTVTGGTASQPSTGDLDIRYRFLEAGNRETEVEEVGFGNTLGVKGFLSDSWEWDLSVGYSRFNRIDRGVNGYLEEARVIDLIENDVFDPFAPVGSRGSIDDARVETSQIGLSKLLTVDLLLTGDVVELSSGPIRTAIGHTTFHESLEQKADPKTDSGQVLGGAGSSNSGDRQVHSVFGEFSIPLDETLEMQVAGRFDNYSDFGNTVNPKVALKWQPTQQWLARASVGTGFMAPSLSALYGARSEGYLTFIDRKGCAQQGGSFCVPQQYRSIGGGNPNLKEERALTANTGVVFQPNADFNFSLDTWLTKIDNVVGFDPEKATEAELAGINTANHGVVFTRDATTGEITLLEAPNLNLSKLDIAGFDVNTEWTSGVRVLDARLGVRDEFSYLFYYKNESFPGTGFEDEIGNWGQPQWRNNATLFVKGPKSEVYLTGKTIPGQKAVDEKSGKKISDYTEFDLGASYAIRPTSSISGGIRNVLGTERPSDPEGGSGGARAFNSGLYDPIGRSAFLTYRQSF